MIDDLTLILVTKDRPQMAGRILDVYRGFLPQERIIVADGTGISENPWQRVARLSVGIETPFTVCASDDDVLIERGLDAAVYFLQRCPGYVGAQGVHYGARLNGDALQLRTLWPAISNESDDRYHRLFVHLARQQWLFFAVHRTEVLRASFALPTGDRFNSNELLCYIRTTAAGKLRALDVPYMVRNEQLHQRSAPFFWLTDSAADRRGEFHDTMAPFFPIDVIDFAYGVYCGALEARAETVYDDSVPDLPELAPLLATGWPGYEVRESAHA